MARTTITPTQVTRDGVADPTATPGTADGHKFQNNGWTYLRATNSNLLVSQAVMFPIPVTVDGEPVEDKMVEVPANTTLTIGPFPIEYYNHPDGTCWVDEESSDILLRVYSL
jgi:hypothetical protein